jgi:GT2 family glycosyltransferase
MKNRNIKTCIILVNYRCWVDTIECINSLDELRVQNCVIVIVDNDSKDNSLEYIETHIKEVIPDESLFKKYSKHLEGEVLKEDSDENLFLIQSFKNRGFAAGNNIGIKFISERFYCDYYWFLNNDTIVKEDILCKYFTFLDERNLNIGICGCTLLYYDERDKIQALGGYYNKFLGIASHIYEGRKYSDIENYSRLCPDYVIGASMFVRREFIDQVGLMSEDYFLYNEELDWILRGKEKGWEIGHCYNAIVYHKEGRSIGSGTKERRTEFAELMGIWSKLKFTRKHYPQYLITTYFTIFLICLNRIRRGQVFLAIKMLKVTFWPKTFKK